MIPHFHHIQFYQKQYPHILGIFYKILFDSFDYQYFSLINSVLYLSAYFDLFLHICIYAQVFLLSYYLHHSLVLIYTRLIHVSLCLPILCFLDILEPILDYVWNYWEKRNESGNLETFSGGHRWLFRWVNLLRIKRWNKALLLILFVRKNYYPFYYILFNFLAFIFIFQINAHLNYFFLIKN